MNLSSTNIARVNFFRGIKMKGVLCLVIMSISAMLTVGHLKNTEELIPVKQTKEIIVEFGENGSIYHQVITDASVISEVLKQINTGVRHDLAAITMEPFTDDDGKINIITTEKIYTLYVHKGSNDVITDHFLIDTDIDFMNLDNKTK